MSGYESAAAEPHPLVAQLSALHQFRIRVDVAVVVVVLTLTNLIAHFTTPWAGVVTVPVAAVALVAWLRINGLGGPNSALVAITGNPAPHMRWPPWRLWWPRSRSARCFHLPGRCS